jgi:hypothetical protein
MTEAGESTLELAAKLRGDLISEAQQNKLLERQADLVKHVMTLEMTGDPAKVSADIGMFQFLRGKYDAFEELLSDHKEAAEQLAANNANANIAG